MTGLHPSLFPDSLFRDATLEAAAEAPERQPHTTGLLPSQHLRDLIQHGCIMATPEIEEGQIQPASLDLRLGPVAHRVRASFLPGAARVEEKIESLRMHSLDLTSPAVLERGCVYIIPLLERLRLPSDH